MSALSLRDATIVALCLQGETYEAVGERFGLSRERVRKIFRRQHPEGRKRPALTGRTVECALEGCTRTFYIKPSMEHRKFCSHACANQDRIEKNLLDPPAASRKSMRAYRMRKAGASWYDIADELGYPNRMIALNEAKRAAVRLRWEWPIQLGTGRANGAGGYVLRRQKGGTP